MMGYGCSRVTVIGEGGDEVFRTHHECILCNQYGFHHPLEARASPAIHPRYTRMMSLTSSWGSIVLSGT